MAKVAFIFLFVLMSVMSFAGEPPKEPMLRIETGVHTARIGQIGIDAGEQYVVTGSDDKTVRLWSLPDLLGGSLQKNPVPLAVYRIPIASGNVGKVYAVAISPDGKLIACGGWTGRWDDSDTGCIYVFDRRSGNIAKTLVGLPNVTFSLRFSPDGKYLAAGLGGAKGIQVYDTSEDYKQVGSDSSYGDYVCGVDFSADGRLVTSCMDGFVRLYDTSFRLVAKEKGSARQPYGVSFSSNGKSIAVGYNDAVNVDVLSGSDLSKLYSANTSDLSKGNLMTVCWSADASALYAGGMYAVGGVRPVMMFPDSGRGAPVSLGGPSSTVLDVAAVSDGRVVFCSADPALGVLGPEKRSSVIYPLIADCRDQISTFSLSRDGKSVGFGYKQFAKEPAAFDVSQAALQVGDLSGVGLAKPLQESGNLQVTDWKSNYEPKLRGEKLKLKQYERSLSLAIAPDQQSFVIGGDWYVRCFDKTGTQKWSIYAPGAAWAVNVAGNGKLCAAAFSDGTIRWYRMSDGKELLAFFPHADKKRWVLWTPSGYYNCSLGGEDILGWHANNGNEKAADFFPASRFRDKYYRPDIVSRLLDTLDEDEAVRLANTDAGKNAETVSAQSVLDARPPVVTILSPEQNSKSDKNTVNVSYTVRSPSGEPVTKVRVLVDGRPVLEESGLTFASPNGEVKKTTEVKVPDGDCRVTVVAENKYAVSESAVVSISGRSTELAVTPETAKPNLYVVAIGVGEYASPDIPKLKYPAKDASDFLASISKQKGALYANVESKLLIDKDAVKDRILNAMQWLEKQTTSKDVAMLFISGHGANDKRGDYYYLPQDFDRKEWQLTGLQWTEFRLTTARVPGKVVLFVDTCDSGNVMGGTTRGVDDMTKALNELISAENGVVVYTASSGNQASLENSKWENGAFTKALNEGISGKADLLKKGKITCSTLNAYIADRVEELTQGRQSPNFSLPRTVTDFKLAVVNK